MDYDFFDPCKNLAMENCIVRYVESQAKEGNYIFAVTTWKNDNTVVIGRNQDPLAECDLNAVEKYKINIARRITGGGAVYHDRGNLNFSFVLPKKYYNTENTSHIIVNAIKHLGADVSLSGRNDITIDGRKFSGNAYYSNDYVGLHHGTILIKSCFDRLGEVLTPDKLKLKNPRVASVKSPVANLSEFLPDVTHQSISKSVFEAFKHYTERILGESLDSTLFEKDLIAKEDFNKTYELYSSREWIFGRNLGEPQLKDYFAWGKLLVYFFVSEGRVDTCEFVTDSISLDIWDKLKHVFCRAEFTSPSLIKKAESLLPVYNNTQDSIILKDVILMLKNLT